MHKEIPHRSSPQRTSLSIATSPLCCHSLFSQQGLEAVKALEPAWSMLVCCSPGAHGEYHLFSWSSRYAFDAGLVISSFVSSAGQAWGHHVIPSLSKLKSGKSTLTRRNDTRNCTYFTHVHPPPLNPETPPPPPLKIFYAVFCWEK